MNSTDLFSGARGNRRAFYAGWSLFVLLSMLHLAMVLWNHYNFRTFAYYYGFYNFGFFDFAHFRCSEVPMLIDGRHSTFMQDHFSLLIPLLSPLYWIAKFTTGTYSLLILQWGAITWGGWATWRFVERVSGHRVAAIAAMFCYFTLYSRFSAYAADFNLAIVGASLIPVFFQQFYFGNTWKQVAIFTLLVITREDFSLWLAFIALYLLVTHRRDPQKRKMAAVFAVVSVAVFVAIMELVIPVLETETAKFQLFNYSALGNSSGEALLFMVRHPLETLRLLFANHSADPAHDGVKLGYYLVFALSGGILLLLRPATLLCLVPVVCKKMFNDDPIRWGIEFYYGIETVSLLPVLLFPVVAAFGHRRATVGAIAVTVSALFVTGYCFEKKDYQFGFSKIKFYSAEFWQQRRPVAGINSALKAIPPDAAVSASGLLLPHLAFREKIYYYPAVHDAEYICANVEGDTWPLSVDDYQARMETIAGDPSWEVIYRGHNMVILRTRNPHAGFYIVPGR